MPTPTIRYQVLIASPGDVIDERDVVDDVIRDWNSSHKPTGIFLQSLRWELDAVPELGDRAQGIINKQLVDNADFVIALFSTRLGTPTGVAVSGTAEEIERLRTMGKHVMVYFSSAPVPRDHNPEQLKLLNEYKRGLMEQGLCFDFKDKDELWRRLSHALATKMSTVSIELAQSTVKSKSEAARLIVRSGRKGRNGDVNICTAIQGRNQISFQYGLGRDPGPRLVEPYMVAYNQAGHLALSAWFLGGISESPEGQGWREYLLSGISDVTILRQQFATPRPGYSPSGGRAFHSIQCAV